MVASPSFGPRRGREREREREREYVYVCVQCFEYGDTIKIGD